MLVFAHQDSGRDVKLSPKKKQKTTVVAEEEVDEEQVSLWLRVEG